MNKDFFTKWSYEMAYILGFLIADGNIHKNGYSVSFAQKDPYILFYIKKCLNGGSICKSIINKRIIYNLIVCSKELVSTLRKLNIVPNKTFIFQPPKVPKKYWSSFLLGFFDGDGSIAKCSTSYAVEFISSSRAMILYVKHILDIVVNKRPIYEKKIKNGNMYILRFYSRWQIKRLFKFLYKNNCVYLKYKKNKFLDALTYYQNHKKRKDFVSEAQYKENIANRNGYKTNCEYKNALAQKNGYLSYYDQYKCLILRRGFKNTGEYRKYLKNRKQK